jgi:hypothetical protein
VACILTEEVIGRQGSREAAECGFILVCFFLSRPQVLPNARKEEAPFSSFSHRNRRLRIAFARLEEAGEANSGISRIFFSFFWVAFEISHY